MHRSVPILPGFLSENQRETRVIRRQDDDRPKRGSRPHGSGKAHARRSSRGYGCDREASAAEDVNSRSAGGFRIRPQYPILGHPLPIRPHNPHI